MKIALLVGIFFYSYVETSFGVLGSLGNDIQDTTAFDEDDEADSEGLSNPSVELVYESDILRLDHHTYQHEVLEKSRESLGTLNGDVLFLLSVYEPNCKHSNAMIKRVEETSVLLDDYFNNTYHGSDILYETSENLSLHLSNVNKPILAKMDISGAEKDELQLHFGDINEATPLLKFILVRHQVGDNYDPDRDHNEQNMNLDSIQLHSLDYVGKDTTAEDMFDTVLHYWYRLIVSERTELSATKDILQSFGSNTDDNVNIEEAVDERVGLVPSKPIFTMSNMDTMKDFISHNERIFNTSLQDFYGTSKREEEFIRSLLESTTKSESFFAFVQCRTPLDSEGGDKNLAIHSSFQEYDQLALQYIYRKDVAFFAILADDCNWMPTKDGVARSIEPNGCVGILEVSASEGDDSTDNGTAFTNFVWKNGSASVYDLSDRPSDGEDREETKLDMAHFAIMKTTPTILWLDRYTTSTIAFPIYRQVHFVLFVDLHTPRKKDGTFEFDSAGHLRSRRAAILLRETAKLHQVTRPNDDVVFLIVPSTSIEIMTTFGIDIWSELDIKCGEMSENRVNGTSDCTERIDSLPAAMITSRRESASFMNTYYMSSGDILNERSENPLTEFLNDYFDQKLSPSVKSEDDDNATSDEQKRNGQNPSLPSGVQILTAKSFPSIFEKPESSKHSLVYFYTPSCGHCKRFDTIYHKLSRLIVKLGWESKISVMKVDISKNEIHFDGIDIRNVPAVYFFPSGRKEEPQELTIEGDNHEFNNVGGINDPVLIVSWFLDMLGKDDLIDLQKLS